MKILLMFWFVHSHLCMVTSYSIKIIYLLSSYVNKEGLKHVCDTVRLHLNMIALFQLWRKKGM